MDYAKDIKEFIAKLAEELTMDGIVYYDKEKLCYSVVRKEWLDEYDMFLDVEEMDFEEKASANLLGWQIDLVRDIQEALTLPDSIEAPPSTRQFEWMEDFIGDFTLSRKFRADANLALSRRRPFANFIQTVKFYGLDTKWYEYRDMRMHQYVNEEISRNPNAEEKQQ